MTNPFVICLIAFVIISRIFPKVEAVCNNEGSFNYCVGMAKANNAACLDDINCICKRDKAIYECYDLCPNDIDKVDDKKKLETDLKGSCGSSINNNSISSSSAPSLSNNSTSSSPDSNDGTKYGIGAGGGALGLALIYLLYLTLKRVVSKNAKDKSPGVEVDNIKSPGAEMNDKSPGAEIDNSKSPGTEMNDKSPGAEEIV